MAATHVNEARKALAAMKQAQNLVEINAKLDLIMAKLGIEFALVKQEDAPVEPEKTVKQEAAPIEPEKAEPDKKALKSAGSK